MVLRSAVCFLALLFLHSAALTEKRMALLIGNEGYASEIGRLSTPHNDVALLERTLKDLGFEVVTVRDVGLGALTRAVNAYARRVQAAGPSAVGFFYYSGHGASDGSTNYLIPVDVKTTETGELWDQSLRLTEITRKLKAEAGNATHFVVFDACRNTLKLTQPGSRAVMQSKGFVPVTQENGMLIAYATAEGELASDVGAGAGPYANVLAEEIIKPGIEAVVMFRAVQRRVRVAIHQEPYLGFSDLGDVYFAGKGEPLAEVRANYEMAERINTEAAWEAFLRTFKTGYYADLASERLRLLRDAAVAAKKKAEEEAAARAQAEAKAKARQEEERLAAEQRAREAAEAKRQADAAAAKKKAEVEAAARVQAEAKAKARQEEERLAAAEQRAREAAPGAEATRAEEERQRIAAREPPKPSDDPAHKAEAAVKSEADREALTRDLQTALNRVGCYRGEINGRWGTEGRAALARFAKVTKHGLAVDEPSQTALELVVARTERVCPLECDTGKIERNGKCVEKAKASAVRTGQRPAQPRGEARGTGGHRVTCLQPALCGGK